MRETPRARRAFSDYLAMGQDRSLRKLHALYCGQPVGKKSPPTTRLETLETWSAALGWQARLDAIAEQERAAIIERSITNKQNRLDALDERWHLMRRVIGERSVAVENATVAGGTTGLLVRTYRLGRGAELVEEFAVDTGLLKELRETERQAAHEMGQWVEKVSPTDADGATLDLAGLLLLARKATDARDG